MPPVAGSPPCAECGFLAGDWTGRDARALFEGLGEWWALASAGLSAAAWSAAPPGGGASLLELGRRTLEVCATADRAPRPAGLPERIAQAGTRAASFPGGSVGPGSLPPALLDAVHAVGHHQLQVGLALATLRLGTPPQTGRVDQVNASDGGVPKRAVGGGEVGRRGLVGDRQGDRRHHGRPFQALCLWSREVIDGWAAEGHPIGPGCAGENLTVSGIDWSTLRTATRLRIGSAVVELSWPAVPCAKQTRWFADGDISRMAYECNPGGVRWYAWVRETGAVHPGDPVCVRP